MNESAILNMIISAMWWEESYGPIVIFVDEPFYRFMVRTNMDVLYHDIIPLPEEIEQDSIPDYANGMFDTKLYQIENIHQGQMNRESIKEYLENIPKEISNNWLDMLMNEEFILSLSQLNSN